MLFDEEESFNWNLALGVDCLKEKEGKFGLTTEEL